MNRLCPLSGLQRRTKVGFSPLSLSPVLWLDYGRGYEVTTGTPAVTGDTVQRWLDQSGGGNHATQATAANRGTLTAAGLQLDSTNDGYITDCNVVRPYTIFVVEQGDAGTFSNLRTINSRDANCVISGRRNSGNNCYLATPVSSYRVPDTNPHILELAVPSTGFAVYWVDGVNRTTTNTSRDWGRLSLGSSGAFSDPAATTIREIIVVDADSTKRTQIRQYLAARHGVTI